MSPWVCVAETGVRKDASSGAVEEVGWVEELVVAGQPGSGLALPLAPDLTPPALLPRLPGKAVSLPSLPCSVPKEGTSRDC